MTREESPFRLQDADGGEPILLNNCSCFWNDYRKKYVMIASESGGATMLGEVWYSEADRPEGPWVHARKIITHANKPGDAHDFYNPTQHPFLDREGGRVIYIEGSYVNTFSGNPHPTPYYEYNQILYRLDLSDPRLRLPEGLQRGAPMIGSLWVQGWALRRGGIGPREREMSRRSGRYAAVLVVLLGLGATGRITGPQVQLVEPAPDPHGSPRPAREARDVPPRTSLYLELAMPPEDQAGAVDPESVALTLQPEGGEAVELLRPGRRFAEGASGWLRPKQELSGAPVARRLRRARATAGARDPLHGPRLGGLARARPARSGEAGTWSFTTEAARPVHALTSRSTWAPSRSDGTARSSRASATSSSAPRRRHFGPTYELMAEARKQHPRAWSYQRDFWMTGTEDRQPASAPAAAAQHRPRARDPPDRRDGAARGRPSCSASRTSSATSSTASRPAGR